MPVPPSSASTQGSKRRAVFTEGPTMRHVVIMTITSAIGLIAVFFVDAVTLFYISMLNNPEQTAAVGRSSYVVGFVVAMSIGLMIGASVVVSRAIGADRYEDARHYAGTALISVVFINSMIAIGAFVFRDALLGALHAEGSALAYAQTYLNIVLPGTPFLGIGMVAMGLLRAVGDAKRSMYITLIGGIFTAILDPIFIFGFHMEVTGAAIVSLCSRIGFAGLGLYFLFTLHDIIAWPSVTRFFKDVREVLKLSVPATLTNLAPQVGAFIIANKIAEFGDSALAGQSIVDRLVPLAFGVIFALSGAIGPIIGQNFGAGNMKRVKQTLIDGMVFNTIYVAIAWALLFLFRENIVNLYSATGDMALMITLFCTFVAGSLFFNGILFVTNAAFNNLGKPLWATGFNWARQTLGVIPFVWLGAELGGLPGIAVGMSLGAIPFAIVASFAAFWLIKKMTPAETPDNAPAPAPAE